MCDDQGIKPITPQHKDLLQKVRPALCPERAFIVGVDGRTQVGKSTTARFLAWQLDVALIETDTFIKGDAPSSADFLCSFDHRLDWLKGCMQDVLESQNGGKGLPVIVEGMFLLELLGRIGYKPHFLVYAESSEPDKYLLAEVEQYEADFDPRGNADVTFKTPKELLDSCD